jgi:hypothetical protein
MSSTSLIQLVSVAQKKKWSKSGSKTIQIQKPPRKPEQEKKYNIQQMYDEYVVQYKLWTKKQFEAFFRQVNAENIVTSSGVTAEDILNEGIEDEGWDKFEGGKRVVVFCYANRDVSVKHADYYGRNGYFGIWAK